MILHLIFNSLIVFFGLAISVELFLYFFKIKNSRIRYFCRSLPILKIPFDLLIFLSYGESLFINLNPLSCEIYVRDFINQLLPGQAETVNSGEHLIIPQYIAMQIPSFWLQCLTIGVIVIALAGIGRKFFQLFTSRNYLKHVLIGSTPYSGSVFNKQLQQELRRLKAEILISSKVEIPFAAGSRYIIFPQNLRQELSQEEFEAVIAHELEHLRWKDPLLKLGCAFVCSICWWIPTTWWLKRFLADQELASDAGVHHYGIDNYALASAVTKTVHHARSLKFDTTAMCLFDSSKSTHLSRLKHILDSHLLLSSNRFSIASTVGIILCVLAFMSFWMC